MKRIFVLSSFLLLVIGLVACGASAETEELVDYHNTYLEEVNPVAEEIDEQLLEFTMFEEYEEALEFYEENIVPRVEKVEEFINSRKPETDVVKELHELREAQLDSWFAGFNLLHEGMEKAVAGEDEEVVMEIFQQSDEKFFEAVDNAQKADDRFLEMADEHDVELLDEEE